MINFSSNKYLIPIAIVIAGFLIGGAIVYINKGAGSGGPAAINPIPSLTPENSDALDSFAKCLTEKGVKFYGSLMCGACAYQKQMFGESMKYVNYVECIDTKTNQWSDTCKEAKIEVVPTWEFPDGERGTGVTSLEKLGALSGCPL